MNGSRAWRSATAIISLSVSKEGSIAHRTYNSGNTTAWTRRSSGRAAPTVTALLLQRIVPGIGRQAGVIASSTDGKRWIERERIEEDLFQVIFANERFVAVGDTDSLLSSIDGTVWQRSSSGTDYPLRAAAFGKGLFCGWGRQSV